MKVCGIMTGTSLDGIDVAICDITCSHNAQYSIRLNAFCMIDFPAGFSDFIRNVIAESNWQDIAFLHFALPELYADAIKRTARENRINISEIELIGVHGQTVWHSPVPISRFGVTTGSTIQLASGSALAKLINIPVVNDFRSGDVALGGQGAPLVPRFDFDFFRSTTANVVCLNIGGMANITSLPENCSAKDVIAFDTGPGNILIDIAMKKYFGKKYDQNGDTAKIGNINSALLNVLLNDEYINAKPPKSTGREYYNSDYLENALVALSDIKKEDIIATLTEFTAESIVRNIKKYAVEPDILYASGGGARNSCLMSRLNSLLPNTAIKLPDETGIPSDAKEAMAFAYLAWRYYHKLPGNLPSVTGASTEALLGSINQ